MSPACGSTIKTSQPADASTEKKAETLPGEVRPSGSGAWRGDRLMEPPVAAKQGGRHRRGIVVGVRSGPAETHHAKRFRR